MLRKAWDFPKAGAVESPEGLEEMPGKARVRWRRKTGIGKWPRAQATPGKSLWGFNMSITQQKSPGKCSQILLHTHPASDTNPTPPLLPPEPPKGTKKPHWPTPTSPGPSPLPSTEPEVLCKLSPGSSALSQLCCRTSLQQGCASAWLLTLPDPNLNLQAELLRAIIALPICHRPWWF